MLKDRLTVVVAAVVAEVCAEHERAEVELTHLQGEYRAYGIALANEKDAFEVYKKNIADGMKEQAQRLKEREDAVLDRERKQAEVVATCARRGAKITTLEENQKTLIDQTRQAEQVAREAKKELSRLQATYADLVGANREYEAENKLLRELNAALELKVQHLTEFREQALEQLSHTEQREEVLAGR